MDCLFISPITPFFYKFHPTPWHSCRNTALLRIFSAGSMLCFVVMVLPAAENTRSDEAQIFPAPRLIEFHVDNQLDDDLVDLIPLEIWRMYIYLQYAKRCTFLSSLSDTIPHVPNDGGGGACLVPNIPRGNLELRDRFRLHVLTYLRNAVDLHTKYPY